MTSIPSIGCPSHFFFDDTPHIGSVTMTGGGTGYTRARARATGGGGSGAKLRCIITGGVIVSIEVVDPGYGFTSGAPTILITGDGGGASAVAILSGGALKMENTTLVPNPACAEGCIATTPPGVCDPVAVPPAPRLDCSIGFYSSIPNPDGTVPSTCHNNTCGPQTPKPPNTYSVKVPNEYIDYSTCRRRGYKVAFAKHIWAGRFGFIENDSPSQTKFLSEEMNAQDVTVFPDGGGTVINRRRTGYTINRHTGIVTHIPDEVEDGSASGFGGFTIENLVSIGYNSAVGWTSNDSDFTDLLNGVTAPGEGAELIVSAENNLLSFEYHYVSPTGQPIISFDATFTRELTGINTPTNVIADCKALLALIDLCDDKKFPWREDVPIRAGAAYLPQFGPSCGPFVEWGTDVDNVTPIVLGAPNPAGYEPFWDFAHMNMEYGSCGSPGRSAFNTQTWGQECPRKYGTATHWSIDLTNNMFPPGSNASYNSDPREYQICSEFGGPGHVGTLVLDGGALWLSKWAEIYLFDFPHHDAARPCGPVDQATIDPDTINCVTNPSGNLRWPTAPSTCIPAGGDSKQGSYSIKRWEFGYDHTAHIPVMNSMSCTGGHIDSPCSFAVFLQDEPLTGKYLNAVQFPAASISFFDDRYDDRPTGHWSLVQFDQAMADPLWKRPAACVTDPDTEVTTKVEDAEAIQPYVENTQCADGECTGYNRSPFNSKCEPGTPMPWSYPLVGDTDI